MLKNLEEQKIKIKNILRLRAGPVRHDPYNADRAMPRPRLKPGGLARHGPFNYRVVPELRMGRHEPGQARAGSARHGARSRWMFRNLSACIDLKRDSDLA
jgi:hypothetical protein